MFLDVTACTKTVSILEAILLGANGACIDLGMSSLLAAVAGFVVSVLVIRFVAMQVLRRVFPGLRGRRSKPLTPPPDPTAQDLTPLPYESPIKSTGAWGSKRR